VKRKRGFTLLETIIASSLLLLLTTALFMGWSTASRSWLGMFRSTTRLTQMEVALRQLQVRLQDASSTAIYQTTPATPALAFSSPWSMGNADTYGYQTGSFNPSWQKYSVYYLNTNAYTLDYTELAIPPTTPASISACTIEQWAGPSGLQPLSFYCTGGNSTAYPVDTFAIARTGAVIQITLSSIPPVPSRGSGNGRLSVSESILLHN
jgi:prepilin-type N-terminal cleavage/methylation domain-containing protein